MFQLERKDPTELPFKVLEEAHWRPQEVQLYEKHKPEVKTRPEYRRLQSVWKKREVLVNFSLDALLMTLTGSERKKLGESLSGLSFTDQTALYGGYSPVLKRTIGVPDFILSDETSAILGEIKLEAKYTFNQYVKYQTFAMLCRSAENLPKKQHHIVIVKDKSSAFGTPAKWKPVLEESTSRIITTGKEEEVADILAKNALELARIYSIGVGLLKTLLKNAKNPVPVTVVTWDEFEKELIACTERKEIRSYARNLTNFVMGRSRDM